MKLFTIEDLMNRVTVTTGGCWVWNGAKNKDGQGVIQTGSLQQTARRSFWGPQSVLSRKNIR
jgi:hypothetical protein